ncbi:amidase signature enzyme [Trametopsis cervina]|nr:amidase signature enzyme [Trametopsis cervina]
MVLFSNPEHVAACAQKRRIIADQIEHYSPRYDLPLTDSDNSVLQLSLADVAHQCSSGQLSLEDVLTSYGKRALAAQSATNCLADLMFDEALDAHIPGGPLAGVPVSLKDVVDIAGHDTTLGFSSRAHKPLTTSAPIVRLLRDAGALLHVKTTVPTGLVTFETTSDLFGETNNPYNSKFSPGASTGGGAALLAYQGSMIEIATDIGGSVRFPPAYCGLYGLRSSVGRFPVIGCQSCVPGLEGIETVSPIAKNLDDLRTFWERVVGMKPWEYDHSCIPIPWRPVDFVLAGRKPRWGVIWNDGMISPTPAVKRAIALAADALTQQGYDVVDFDAPSSIEGLKIGLPLAFADGGAVVMAAHSRTEVVSSAITALLGISKIPRFVKTIISACLRWFSRPLGRNDRFADLFASVNAQTVSEERLLNLKRSEYRASWQQALRKQGIDFILSPIHALPPMPKGGSGVASLLSANYAFIFSILDYSAGVVPTTFVDKDLDALPEDFKQSETYQWLNDAERDVFSLYDADAMHGLPLAVQISGGRLEEEKVLEGMKLLEIALRDSGRPFIQKRF